MADAMWPVASQRRTDPETDIPAETRRNSAGQRGRGWGDRRPCRKLRERPATRVPPSLRTSDSPPDFGLQNSGDARCSAPSVRRPLLSKPWATNAISPGQFVEAESAPSRKGQLGLLSKELRKPPDTFPPARRVRFEFRWVEKAETDQSPAD